MLWILLAISAIVLVTCLVNDYEDCNIIAFIFFIAMIVFCCFNLYEYNEVKSTCAKEITVLEENNKEVLASIEPVVEKYLNYEKGTLQELKPDASTLIGLSAYPQLKGDTFVQSQLNVILKNNEEIKNRKLALARLNSYKLWLFMGE